MFYFFRGGDMSETGFFALSERDPGRLALVEPDGTRHTAGKLGAEVNKLSHGLRALGLMPGDAVATVLPNEAAMVEVALAAAQSGLYLVPVNHHLTAPEIAYILADSEACAVITGGPAAATVLRACEEAKVPPGVRFSTGGHAGFRPYAELKADRPPARPAERRAGLVMNYTSGTTGRPKGVRRPLPEIDPDQLASRYAMFLRLFGIPQNDGVHLVVSPLYHTAVLSFCTNHLHNGDAIVLMEKWAPEEMLRVVEKERVTSSHMVPTHMSRLLALPDELKRKHDLSSLRHVIHSAAPCPVEVKRKMLAWWGPVIYEYYAASEGGGTQVGPAEWLQRPGTVGRAWPMSEIRVLDDSGQPCPPRQVGTVYMRMGDYKFEYHRDKKKTDSAYLRDSAGFFTVGDAGYLDEDGYLFLCDRKSDMIISGGVNIYPAEIEAALIGHPKVRDVAVFGIPDDDWGESVKAVVEPSADANPTPELAEELRAWLGERIAKLKIPRSIDFTDALPRDPSGKLYKRKLRDPYWEGRDRRI
jgi:long-chain acyl-CoA synthetase